MAPASDSKVFVRGIRGYCDEDELREHFSAAGKVSTIDLLSAPKLQDCCVVTFEQTECAALAVATLNLQAIHTRAQECMVLKVSEYMSTNRAREAASARGAARETASSKMSQASNAEQRRASSSVADLHNLIIALYGLYGSREWPTSRAQLLADAATLHIDGRRIGGLSAGTLFHLARARFVTVTGGTELSWNRELVLQVCEDASRSATNQTSASAASPHHTVASPRKSDEELVSTSERILREHGGSMSLTGLVVALTKDDAAYSELIKRKHGGAKRCFVSSRACQQKFVVHLPRGASGGSELVELKSGGAASHRAPQPPPASLQPQTSPTMQPQALGVGLVQQVEQLRQALELPASLSMMGIVREANLLLLGQATPPGTLPEQVAALRSTLGI